MVASSSSRRSGYAGRFGIGSTPNAVAVHAVPSLLRRGRPERLVRDLVAELGQLARRPFADAADLVLLEHEAGGFVFSTGSIGWIQSMAVGYFESDTARVTQNALSRALARRAAAM